MKIKIYAKGGLKITEGINRYIDKKFQFLDKFAKEDALVKLYIKKEGCFYMLKIIIPTFFNKTMVIRHSSDDFYFCIDRLFDKTKETYLQNHNKCTLSKKRNGQKNKLMVGNDKEIELDEGLSMDIPVELLDEGLLDLLCQKYN